MVKKLLISLAIAGPQAIFAMALPGGLQSHDVLPDGYRVVPLHWTGIIEEGGDNLTFQGTIQEIEAEIQKSKPEFSWKTAFKDRIDSRDPSGLDIRNKNSEFFCTVGGDGKATTLAIGVNSMSLIYAGGICGVGPGPRVCARISCEYDGAIWLCNDNTWPIAPQCGYLATYADDIVNTCGMGESFGEVQGQEFDTDNYNVAVGHAQCR
ncbi:hypothetical protein F5X99DRAFT_407741 [Biscogniauxia marginata]|nr:hypothetical protein F5X99DRAFT_407741 [Biscogniauxia marginata]